MTKHLIFRKGKAKNATLIYIHSKKAVKKPKC